MPKKANGETESENSDVGSLQPLFEAMLTLLGRFVYPPEKIREILTKSKKKKDPKGYVKAYNLCDGEHTLSEIAKVIDVSIGTLSPILSEWKELGIIYEITKNGRQFYKRLYRLGPRSADTSEENEESAESAQSVAQNTPASPEPTNSEPNSLQSNSNEQSGAKQT